MIKKILLASIIAASIAIALTVAPLASADYYDCNGNLQPGEPGPSECHYFVQPQQRDPQRTSRDKINVLQPQQRDPQRTPRDKVNVLQPQQRDPQSTEDRYEIRNAKKYCIRDYCYYVYDYCNKYGNCVRKQRKYGNPNYNPYENKTPNRKIEVNRTRPQGEGNNTNSAQNKDYNNNIWNYWVNNYINNHYYKYQSPGYCHPNNRNCIYRGFSFGGYHNGYWY